MSKYISLPLRHRNCEIFLRSCPKLVVRMAQEHARCVSASSLKRGGHGSNMKVIWNALFVKVGMKMGCVRYEEQFIDPRTRRSKIRHVGIHENVHFNGIKI